MDPEVKCVTVGFDFYFNYPKLVTGTTYVEKHDCIFICTNDDGTLPTEAGSKVVIPGTGTMVNSMRTSCLKTPVTYFFIKEYLPRFFLLKDNLPREHLPSFFTKR